jgi:hypothetical protein
MNPNSPPPQKNPGTVSKSSSPNTKFGQSMEILLQNITEPIDILGQQLMGDLWRTVCLTVQDAIALSILLELPGFLIKVLIHKDFSNFYQCQSENSSGISRYACYYSNISSFCLWIILSARLFSRFWSDLKESKKGK